MSWSKGIAEWIENDTAFISGVFSWNAQKAYMRCVYYREMGYKVRVGGQVVYQFPEMFENFDTSGKVDALSHHNPLATFTSRGCIRNCSFCLVPKMEGKLIELDDYPIRPIICDNNLLATSEKHFNKVIDNLLDSNLTGIDFNQGLDARILSEHHARRLAELPQDTLIRLAWDHIKTESIFFEAFTKLKNAGIKTRQIRVYILIGYNDTPEDALYRLEKVRKSGMFPNPMRYQPISALKKNAYIGEKWTHELLQRIMRFYSNLGIVRNLTFDEFKRTEKLTETNKEQIGMEL